METRRGGEAGTPPASANPRASAPKITITADRDTIYGSLEHLHLMVKRSEAGNRLALTLKLEQDEQWLTDRSREVTIHAGDTIADLTIPRSDFKSDVTRSGDLTTTVDDVSGYDTGDAKATVFVISQADPVVTFSLSQESHNPDGTACEDFCRHLIHVTDEEDIPDMELSVSPEEIMEEDETSSTATLSITGDKSFARDQVVTLALGGTATKGADYVVTPPDADQEAEDYQVVLPVESNSIQVTLKAMSDDVNDPDEKIEVAAVVDGRVAGDMRDERVTLTVGASGGGYDGRIANVVVNVGDDDGMGGDVDDEAGALRLLQGLTPEGAAAALFGEGDLSEEQLGALDRLGNGNGKYDLGDLLAWSARCRQRRRTRRRRSVWLALLLAVAVGACADDIVEPRAAEPNPGYLTVELVAPPAARDIGALLVVEGPGIDSVRAPGFKMFQSESSSPRQIVVAGMLTTGPIAEFRVPDRALRAQYRVRLLEVTGEDYSLRDLSEYEVVITR